MIRKAPSAAGAFLVSATPPIGKAPGVGTGDGGGVVAEFLGKPYPVKPTHTNTKCFC